MLEAVLQQLEKDADAAVDRLKVFLSIASVSTDPARAEQVRQGADWVARTLHEIGLEPEVRPTCGHPIVLSRTGDADVLSPDAPRVLFYGHYDVQPPDPLEAWTTPPFEPQVRDGAIHARGAADDKGQVCTFLESLRGWKAVHGKFPVPLQILIEGEEEVGSQNLSAFLENHRDELKSDVVVISDTQMWDDATVAITYGLRGLIYLDVQLHNADRDLHSGIYGGILANPANILARVLAGIFDENNRITIPGFYDDMLPITAEERRRWNELGFDEIADCLGPVGVDTPFGETGYTTLERRWARPSCDICGLYGGYGGEGAKTIIPAFAGAKVSFRIPPSQNPHNAADAFENWLRSHDVHGCRWRITHHGECAPVVLPVDSPYLEAATAAIDRATGKRPVLIREGATLPVVADFKRTLGLDSLLIGFTLPDDRIHAPNEKLDLCRFRLGCRTHAALLAELSRLATP